MIEQLGFQKAPRLVQAPLTQSLAWASQRLGNALARFDGRIGDLGIAGAAAATLEDLGAEWCSGGERPPVGGPLLVVANHPGAYDALVLLAAMGRRDVGILAAKRSFLRALPELQPHLLLLSAEGAPSEQIAGLRQAFVHLSKGHVVLHFPAGRIEPDPRFAGSGPILCDWRPGTAALVRAASRVDGKVVAALVSGVHSPRAKRHWLSRFAERRGVTTVAPLLQIVLRRFRDVRAVVRFGEAIDAAGELDPGGNAAITDRLRGRVLALAE
jgi:1-acyl-sn-glycerol-3-phosphate acyltransferase